MRTDSLLAVPLAFALLALLFAACDSGGSPSEEPPQNAPPTVTLTAEDAGPRARRITATASDPDGSVAAVQLDLDGDQTYELTRPSGIDTVLAYEPGSYTLRAKATDDEGAESGVATAMIQIAATPIIDASAWTLTFSEDPAAGYHALPLDALRITDGILEQVTLDDGGSVVDRIETGADSIRIIPVSNAPSERAEAPYRLAISASNDAGEAQITVEGAVRAVTDLRPGQIYDNTNGEGHPGRVRVFDPEGNMLTEVVSDFQGNYQTKQLENHDFFVVKHQLDDGSGQLISYTPIDTLETAFSGQDIGGGRKRVNRLDGLIEEGIDPETFAEFVFVARRGNLSKTEQHVHSDRHGSYIQNEMRIGGERYREARILAPGQAKSHHKTPGKVVNMNLEDFVGFYVMKQNPRNKPNGDHHGRFRAEGQEWVREALRSEELGGAFIPDSLDYVIELGTLEREQAGDVPYDYELSDNGEQFVRPDQGWIVVEPDTVRNFAGAYYTLGQREDYSIDTGGLIVSNYDNDNEAYPDKFFIQKNIIHELMHQWHSVSHADEVFGYQRTIMRSLQEGKKPKYADLKLNEFLQPPKRRGLYIPSQLNVEEKWRD